MADLRSTPTRLVLMRAISRGDVTEYRDGALSRTVLNAGRTVPYNRIAALEEAGLIQIVGGRPGWTAGTYAKPFELTDAGEEWLARHTEGEQR